MAVQTRVKWAFWRTLNASLHTLELLHPPAAVASLPAIPVFIIGAPRSGSTLLYQTLVEAFDFGYLANIHCRFFGAPSLVERWLMPRLSRQPLNYQSENGRTRGCTAPSECGNFWYRFFPREPQAVNSLPPEKLHQLRTSVYRLTAVNRRPFLFKNLINSVRLRPLGRALPEARYIVIHRHPASIAKSLLSGRKRLFGSYNHWWSVRPANVEVLEQLDAHQQVVEQIIAVYDGIDIARSTIGPEYFFDIQYEAFCRNVHGSLDAIEYFLANSGVRLQHRSSKIPPNFPISQGEPLDMTLMQALLMYIEEQRQRGRLQ
ncbi:MAG: sulfotransferase [Chloroflexi bacterium]|nr:sulfotransferase [Chloroflexota bacterium]